VEEVRCLHVASKECRTHSGMQICIPIHPLGSKQWALLWTRNGPWSIYNICSYCRIEAAASTSQIKH
jgi:hypothetical protein